MHADPIDSDKNQPSFPLIT